MQQAERIDTLNPSPGAPSLLEADWSELGQWVQARVLLAAADQFAALVVAGEADAAEGGQS